MSKYSAESIKKATAALFSRTPKSGRSKPAWAKAYLPPPLRPRESPLIAQAKIDNPLIAYDKVWTGALERESVSAQSADVTKFKPQTRSKLASWAPNLRYYDLILVNTSGGKDSAALMIRFNALLKKYPEEIREEIRDRVVAIHSDLGIAEHPEVIQVVREHARLMGVPLVVVEPKTYGEPTDLFLEVEKRGRAPGHGTRYCTSKLKTGEIEKWINAWIRERAPKAGKTGSIITHYERRVRVLNLLGLRAQESKGRAKAGFKIKGDITSRKVVHEWLPIQFMETEDVWRSIQRQGYPYHAAYAAGFGRLSCAMCPLAGKEDLQLGMLTYPQMAQRMIDLEDKYNFKWKEDHSAKKLLELAESNPEMMKKARAARKILRRQGGPVMRYLQQGQVPLGSRNLEDLDQLILRFTQ